jgi:hypothetical protein
LKLPISKGDQNRKAMLLPSAVLREYIKVLIYLVIGFGILDTILVLLGQKDLSTYFIANSIIFLLITQFSINLHSSIIITLNILSTIIVLACLIVVTLKIYNILS